MHPLKCYRIRTTVWSAAAAGDFPRSSRDDITYSHISDVYALCLQSAVVNSAAAVAQGAKDKDGLAL